MKMDLFLPINYKRIVDCGLYVPSLSWQTNVFLASKIKWPLAKEGVFLHLAEAWVPAIAD